MSQYRVVVRWPCCNGLLGYHFQPLGVAPSKDHVSCSSCGAVHKESGELLRYRAGSLYSVPATWTRILPPLDVLDDILSTPPGISAERLGVTPESFAANGYEPDWWSNPQNMPPPPGSPRWGNKDSPLWRAIEGNKEGDS